MDRDNIRDANFSAFACMEVAATLISRRLPCLMSNVRDLVEEINFDVRVEDGETKREKVV